MRAALGFLLAPVVPFVIGALAAPVRAAPQDGVELQDLAAQEPQAVDPDAPASAVPS